jgi:superfamily I DNA/RNA helicase
MRALADVKPTPEQLAIVSRNRPGTEVIRGAAGSGKTTTALLRLRSLIGMFVNRKKRQHVEEPVRVLVLTYNRTLRGYIDALARQQALVTQGLELEISTFGKWAWSLLGKPQMIDERDRAARIKTLGKTVGLAADFLVEEVDYVIGRFPPDSIKDYVTTPRHGRGATPRVNQATRERILNEVIEPYRAWKQEKRISDWNDLAVALSRRQFGPLYDIIIADETQDFSANEIRAIKNQLAPVHSLTLVIDSAQRIYPRGFTWQEAGIIVRPENSRRLERNYRNTVEIARFATPLIEGIPIDDDGTIPDFSKCERRGRVPVVLKGRFSAQVRYVVQYLRKNVDLRVESVAILHMLGGHWFDHARWALRRARLDFAEITRQSDWPSGPENIALSTVHSAKGLEFDHVVIIGLNAEITPHGAEEEDDRLTKLRRLLAMGIGRARESVVLGYKPEDASRLIQYLDPSTYEEVPV